MIDKVFAGRYRITEKIGMGGMAEVYKATDETLGRTVAVKVMLSQYASDETFVVRFKQEAQAAANLQSPYIVNIYDWGYEESSQNYYIVMEYVRGTDLKTAITQRGAINQRKVAEIGAQVAAALGVAHSYDVIHRDIKPQNIMVQPDGNAKVMDFGIARANSANMTQTGSVLGTAYYVSPEQAQGKDLTAATDIYSLGVVLYEAATGRVPFDGPDAVSIAVKQVNEQPVPPRSLDDTIDPALESIILRAMQKNPADRFSTADEMRLTLSGYLQGRPLDAVDPDALTRVITTPAVVLPAEATAVMPAMGGDATLTKAGGTNKNAKKKNNKPLIITLVVVLAVLLVAVAGYLTFCSGGDIEVPKVVGETLEDATVAIEDAKLVLGEVTTKDSETVAEGMVISQDPAALSKVAEGKKVNLVVSSGSSKIDVPDLLGMTPEVAQETLEGRGLKYAVGTPKSDPTIAEGRVCAQSHTAGDRVTEGTKVTVNLSSGPETVEPATASIPNVIGMEETSAINSITAQGFHVNVSRSNSNTVDAGFVITQDKSGTRTVGETVTITVSTGPASTPVEQVQVPDFTGWAYADAVATLTNLGLKVSAAASSGTVASQSPAGGTMVDKGSTVKLTMTP